MQRCTISANFCEFTEEEIDKIDELRQSFQVSELVASSRNPKLIEINTILVNKECRGQGVGSKVLQSLCKDKDDTIIIAGAGALASEYPEEPSVEEYDNLFTRLTSFYNNNNFQDVTELFGTYEGTTKRTFLYLNAVGNKAIEDRKSFINKQI